MPIPELAPEKAEEFPPEKEPDYSLRYKVKPVKALKTCQERFKKHRMCLYELLATIYAISLRLMDDQDGQDKFLKDSYWSNKRVWKTSNSRDFFRLVARYVLDAEDKDELTQASKIAKVLWYLHEDKIHPNDAASAIFTSGGIEKIARHGLFKKTLLHPLDFGDGMTVRGEKIHYPDDQDEEEEVPDYDPDDWSDVEVEFLNTEKLIEYAKTVRDIEELDEKVTISATYRKMRPLVLTFIIESVTPVPPPRKKKALLASS